MRAPSAPRVLTIYGAYTWNTVGSGTVVVLGRRGYGVIVRSIRTGSLLIEWHHFRSIVGRIDDRLPCLTGVGT